MPRELPSHRESGGLVLNKSHSSTTRVERHGHRFEKYSTGFREGQTYGNTHTPTAIAMSTVAARNGRPLAAFVSMVSDLKRRSHAIVSANASLVHGGAHAATGSNAARGRHMKQIDWTNDIQKHRQLAIVDFRKAGPKNRSLYSVSPCYSQQCCTSAICKFQALAIRALCGSDGRFSSRLEFSLTI